jgi:Zn-dependent protease with chaperone function
MTRTTFSALVVAANAVIAAVAIVAMTATLWPAAIRASELEVSDADAESHRVRLAAAGLDLMIERQLRVSRVDARIRLANAVLCTANLAPVTGIVARTADELPQSFRDVAYQQHGVGDLIRVLGLVPGFAGAESGVRVGDTILRVNGHETHLAASLEGRPVSESDPALILQIERDRRVFDLRLDAGEFIGCDQPADLLPLDIIDLYPQHTPRAKRVRIGTGMLRLLDSDDELAILLAHELAHRLLALEQEPDAPIEEIDADRLGLYLAARAGFEVAAAVSMFQRLERESPLAVEDRTGYAHRVSAQRWIALESTAAEIEQAQRLGLPLGPESW